MKCTCLTYAEIMAVQNFFASVDSLIVSYIIFTRILSYHKGVI